MLPSRVVIDACVLYDAAVRDLLLRLGMAGLIEPVWSAHILDECFTALARTRPDITDEQRDRLRGAMTRAFPRGAVPPTLVDIALPGPNDVHVVGTALAAHAPFIVTYNLSDFPAESLAAFGLRAVHPDTLTTDLLRPDPGAVVAVLTQHAQALRKPPTTVERLLATLDARGLRTFASAVREELARRAWPTEFELLEPATNAVDGSTTLRQHGNTRCSTYVVGHIG